MQNTINGITITRAKVSKLENIQFHKFFLD
jgi:hypothetical protein